MKIETYEIEEINSSEASVMAADGESAELIEKLGLAGQRELINPESGTRFQYPRMTKLQTLVFETCFPVKTKLDAFRHEIIPLRVLQVAAFCRDFQQTAFLEVWHTAIPKQDPILVGRKESYSSENYLLARWGDSLDTFEQLIEKARPILKAKCVARLNKLKSGVKEIEVSLDDDINNALLTGEPISFSVYA